MLSKEVYVMKVIVVEPMKPPAVREMEDTLPQMQEVVGGPIQAVYPFDEAIALICHEEGKLLGLPLNRALYDAETGTVYDVIAGTFFLCGAPPEEEHFGSLTEPQIAWLSRRFARPEQFWKIGRQLLVLPAEGGR